MWSWPVTFWWWNNAFYGWFCQTWENSILATQKYINNITLPFSAHQLISASNVASNGATKEFHICVKWSDLFSKVIWWNPQNGIKNLACVAIPSRSNYYKYELSAFHINAKCHHLGLKISKSRPKSKTTLEICQI